MKCARGLRPEVEPRVSALALSLSSALELTRACPLFGACVPQCLCSQCPDQAEDGACDAARRSSKTGASRQQTLLALQPSGDAATPHHHPTAEQACEACTNATYSSCHAGLCSDDSGDFCWCSPDDGLACPCAALCWGRSNTGPAAATHSPALMLRAPAWRAAAAAVPSCPPPPPVCRRRPTGYESCNSLRRRLREVRMMQRRRERAEHDAQQPI